jgi:signal transduction histidine kinase
MPAWTNSVKFKLLGLTTSLWLVLLVPGAILLRNYAVAAVYASAGPGTEAHLLHAQATELTCGIFAGVGLLFLLATGAAWLAYERYAGQPLRCLLLGAIHSSRANLPGEFSALAQRLDALSVAARDKGDQLDAQRRSFYALLSLSESIDVTLAAEKVLQFTITKVQEVTGFATVAMRLLEPDQRCFRLVAQHGMSPRMIEDLHRVPVEIGFTGDVYKTHRAAHTSDLAADPRLESPSPVEMGYRSLISVPFLSGDRLIGTMELATKDSHRWTGDEIRWLELVGRSIGNVLHHIETSSQLQGLAVMQERSRIAQEIHDGLAQLIGTLRLWAEEAQLALYDNDLREVQSDLQKIEQTARDAYASLREEILGLRYTISPEQGILPVIREYLSRYQRQWGIETQLVQRPVPPDGHEQSTVSPAAEIQLLRIIQEALTNVRRHANASRVTVAVDEADSRLRVEVYDNGRGFAPAEVPDDKLGLRIMRERAASVGGRVVIESRSGEGTHLAVEIPKQEAPLPALPLAEAERIG